MLYLWIWSQSGIRILVQNNGVKTISNVQIIFSGGKQQILKLSPNQQWSFRINPQGESALTVKFIDELGLDHIQLIDVYLETGYTGKIKIKIDSDLKTTWEDDVKL